MNRVSLFVVLGVSAGTITSAGAGVIGIDNRNGFDADTMLANGADFDQFRSTIAALGHTIIQVNDFTDLSGLDALIVSDRRAAPSEATSLSVWEINYLMAKMVVKDIMRKDVVTVGPDITVECAVATAQERGVGAVPVLEEKMVAWGVLGMLDQFLNYFIWILAVLATLTVILRSVCYVCYHRSPILQLADEIRGRQRATFPITMPSFIAVICWSVIIFV